MISLLNGQIAYKDHDTIVVDVAGVGYEVTVTQGVLAACGGVGESIQLVVHTDVRENAIQLIGFKNHAEKTIFLLLKKVKGIGTRLSLAVVSTLAVDTILGSIGRGDTLALSQVPGIGRKTAERLIVELRERVAELASEMLPLSTQIKQSQYSASNTHHFTNLETGAIDAILALEKLGFSREKAEMAIRGVIPNAPSGTLDAGELMRLALSKLS